MTERLKTSIWVSAQIRLCDRQALPVFVVHKGFADAGAVLLKLNRLGGGCVLLSQVQGPDGVRAWMQTGGKDPLEESEADAIIARHISRDRDLWVLEIEDPEEHYIVDGPVL